MDPDVRAKVEKYLEVYGGGGLPWTARKTGTRNVFGDLFRELGYTKGAEIGVWRGQYSEILLKANPGLHMLCVDAWVRYTRRTRTSMMEKFYEETKRRLAPYNVTIMRATSVDAAKTVRNRSLDFVYIDGGHDFQNICLDLINWVPKVRHGGIVAGHDYGHDYNCAVQAVVDTYTRYYGIDPWYMTGDYPRSFLWVR